MKHKIKIVVLTVLATFGCLNSMAFTPIKTTAEGKMKQDELQVNFLARQGIDRKRFSSDILKEIESLYQIANEKPKSTDAAMSLKEIIQNPVYKGANRVGCALVYLSDIPSESADAVQYLKQAIEEYSSSWYGSSVQVGPLAKFKLANIYMKQNKRSDAEELFEDIKLNAPKSLDHDGVLLTEKIKRLEGKKK